MVSFFGDFEHSTMAYDRAYPNTLRIELDLNNFFFTFLWSLFYVTILPLVLFYPVQIAIHSDLLSQLHAIGFPCFR